MWKMHRAGARVKSPNFKPSSWLLQGVSWGAIALSCALAAVGVAGLVGFGSWLARLGTAILIFGTLLTEVAASRLPLHAELRVREGSPKKGLAVAVGFIVLTAWNLIAGHFGMSAIDQAGLVDKRGPLEHAVAVADAASETAREALSEFDAETRAHQDALAGALRGAFEAGYVTAGTRAANADDGREAQRQALQAAAASKRGEAAAAHAALEHAPRGRSDIELWAFAVVIEILKGALVWFSTGAGRRGVSHFGVQFEGDLKTLTPEARVAIKRKCASTLATLRHLEAALV